MPLSARSNCRSLKTSRCSETFQIFQNKNSWSTKKKRKGEKSPRARLAAKGSQVGPLDTPLRFSRLFSLFSDNIRRADK